MVQAISACPTTIAEIIALSHKIAADTIKVDEVVDGFVDLNESATPQTPAPHVAASDEDEEDEEEEQHEPQQGDEHDVDGEGEEEEDEDAQSGSPRGSKRARINGDGDSVPGRGDSQPPLPRVKTQPRDVDQYVVFN